MAATGSKKLLSYKKIDESSLKFEDEIKKMVNWSKKEWDCTSEANSRTRILCNSMNYWSKKLKPALEARSIIVTLFNYDRDVKVSLLELIDGLDLMECKVELCGFSEFRNPRYICLYFKDEEEKNYVESNFRKVNDNYVVYLNWALASPLKNVKVHWLAMTEDVNIIKKHLENYFIFKDHKKEALTLMSGKELCSGKVSFRAAMKEGVSVDDVPHVMYIRSMEALITIQGRSPLCLTCNVVGHIAKYCPTPFCVKCKSLQVRVHKCDIQVVRSYASIVKESELSGDYDERSEVNLDSVEREEQKIPFGQNSDITKTNELPKVIKDESPGNVIIRNCDKENLGETADSLMRATQSVMLNNTVVLNSDQDDSVIWVTHDASDSDADLEEDDDTSHAEVFRNMESYIQELNSFRVAETGEGSEEIPVESQKSGESNTADMEIDAKAPKRKMQDEATVRLLGESNSNNDWIKCYGRGRRGRRVRDRDKVFEDKNEIREFVFND